MPGAHCPLWVCIDGRGIPHQGMPCHGYEVNRKRVQGLYDSHPLPCYLFVHNPEEQFQPVKARWLQNNYENNNECFYVTTWWWHLTDNDWIKGELWQSFGSEIVLDLSLEWTTHGTGLDSGETQSWSDVFMVKDSLDQTSCRSNWPFAQDLYLTPCSHAMFNCD